MNDLEAEAANIKRDMRDFEKDLFKQWHNNIILALKDKDKSNIYKMTGQLMEFDREAGDLLKVNYSDKLVTLVKDYRALCEHGFKDNIDK